MLVMECLSYSWKITYIITSAKFPCTISEHHYTGGKLELSEFLISFLFGTHHPEQKAKHANIHLVVQKVKFNYS